MTQKFLVTIVCAIFALAEPAKAGVHSFYFSGAFYVLATVDVAKDGTITNEYVPQGQTIENWTTLIGVRYWPNMSKVTKAADGWVAVIRNVLVQNAQSYAAPGVKDDIIVEAWLGAPDKSYFEIDLHRFVREHGLTGVKGYQYALRLKEVGGKADPTQFMKQRDALVSELNDLNVAAVEKK